MTGLVALCAGACAVDLYPAIGGSIGRFTWRHPDGGVVDLLRPVHQQALAAGNSEGAACFPLLPFSNRLCESRFTFNGREIVLPRNTSGPHIEHGHGWQRPWSVRAMSDTTATIGFNHDPAHDATWPFAYAAEQTFTLDPSGLAVTLCARNLDQRPMPIGLGLHPYFPRTPLCQLQADVDGFWTTDAEVLPLHLRDVPPEFDLRPGLLMNDVVVDNVFTGFQGHANIVWPEHRTKLTLTASPPLRFLVVYVPDAVTTSGETAAGSMPYFCAEPVSNISNAFNLASDDRHPDTGMITLAPGAEISARLRFQPDVVRKDLRRYRPGASPAGAR